MTKARIATIVTAVALLIATTGGGCDDSSSQDKAKRDCLAKGGIYQKTSDHSGNCLPPPGGWQ